MSKVLEGVKVLEFTHVISGSYCGMLLGDLGADVLKMESPGKGEFYRSEALKNENGVSLLYPNYNRNKRGFTLNLRAPEAKKIALELIEKTDVFVENMRPGLLSGMGLSYDALKKVNPGLIMVSISGFGQTGPYASKPAYDMTISAVSGFMSVNGPEGTPMKSGPAISDFLSGIYGAFGALAAVLHREKTGEGQYIDVSMMECSMSILDAYFAQTRFTGAPPQAVGNRRPNYAPVNTFPARDGFVYIAPSTQKSWEALARLMGREDLLTDPRFSQQLIRKQNEAALEAIVAEWSARHTTLELQSLLDGEQIANAPVQDVGQVMEDPQVRARKSLLELDYPGIGSYPMAALTPKFSTLEVSQRRAPLLGEHNREVYCQVLGYSEGALEELQRSGVV